MVFCLSVNEATSYLLIVSDNFQSWFCINPLCLMMSNHSIVHVVSLNLYFSLNWVTNNLHCLCLWYCFNFQSWFHIKPYVHDAISNHLIIHHVVSLNLDLLPLLFKPFIYLVLRQTFELFQVFYQSLMWQNSTSFNCHSWCY